MLIDSSLSLKSSVPLSTLDNVDLPPPVRPIINKFLTIDFFSLSNLRFESLKIFSFNLGQLLTSRLVNGLLLEQLRSLNFEQLLISRLASRLLEQLSSVISGQRFRFKYLIELFEQLSLVRLVTLNSVKLFPEQLSSFSRL